MFGAWGGIDQFVYGSSPQNRNYFGLFAVLGGYPSISSQKLSIFSHTFYVRTMLQRNLLIPPICFDEDPY